MPSLLSTADLNSIISEVRSIVSDDTIGTTISYYKFSGTSASDYVPNIGNLPSMYSVSSVSAFKGGYKPDEVMQSGGLIQGTDIKFIIMRDDVSGVLSVDDQIVELGSNYQSRTTYEVKSINRDPLAICYFFQCRTL